MGWDELHRAALAELRDYSPASLPQQALRQLYLDRFDWHPDVHRKSGPPEHLTASCVVLDPSGRRVALTLHKKANQWYQFGGHLEQADTDLKAAALREGSEESGLTGLELIGGILELDRHELVGDFGHCRAHLDVRFVAHCPDQQLMVSDESLDVAWFDVDELPNPELTDLVASAVRRLRSQ